MEGKPFISIIVPVYMVEEYIDDCVKSIINQDFTDFELILVNDGSPDKCPQICDRWALKDKRIKVIHKKNGGLSDARNYGINAALGEYVWFVDSDDWIANDALETIFNGYMKYPTADALAIQIIENQEGKETFTGIESEWPSEDTLMSNLNVIDNFTSILPSVRYVVKNSIYKNNNLRFIVGVLHEDIPFCHMLMHFTKQIALIPRVVYYYRIRGGSITTSPNINSCYSLVKSHKIIKNFINSNVPQEDKPWFIRLSYDLFYEMFLRIRPFIGKHEYNKFMDENGEYIKREFGELRCFLTGKRRLLSYIFFFSPQWYSKLIYRKRFC